MTKRKRIKKLSTDPSAFPDKPIKFKPFRRYKVKHSEWEYQLDEPWYRRDCVGEIQLKGKWLVSAGFDVGSYVTVAISQGQLIIRPEKEEDGPEEA